MSVGRGVRMPAEHAEPTSKRASDLLKGMLPAGCVLAISLCGTALAWHFTQSATIREAQARFETEIDGVQIDLSERFRAYEQLLRAGVSVFHSWPSVTRENWRDFIANLRIAENYPGIQGIGYAELVSPAEKDAHVQRIRSQGFSDYRIWPEGERSIYTTILYLEPFDWRNQRAFGYDMFSEPVRRDAMERARDTGQIGLSDKVTLVQETQHGTQAGFLMYLPLYRTASPDNLEDRRRELSGYVYSPFRMGDFMNGLLGDRKRLVELQIYGGESTSDDALMYSTAGSSDLQAHTAPSFAEVVPFEFHGHIWTLRFMALPSLKVNKNEATIVLLSGVLISLSLSGITWSLARHRALAAGVNERLRQDIATRTKIEEQLREKEENFRYLFEKNPNPMWVFDQDTLSFLEVNDAALAHYGYSRDEFQRMQIADLRPAEDVPRLMSYLRERTPGLRGAGEWRHVTKDGRVIDVEVVSHTLQFQHRNAVLVVIRDITESKSAEASLRESEALARGVLDNALDAYIRMDHSGRITEWNVMAETTFGWTRAEAIGQSVDSLIIPPELREAHRIGLARFLATGEGPLLSRRIELDALRRDGRTIPVEASITAVNAVGQRVFSGFLRDLTEKKLAEGQLRQAQKMEAVGQLTGGIAHDFNNLLTVIIGSLEMATERAARDRQLAVTIGQALKAAEKGAALTHRLLAFSRQQALQPTQIDLNQLVDEMSDLLRRTLGEDVEIEIGRSEKLWPTHADRSQIENALLNLTINSRDAMTGGGKLTIDTANVNLDSDYAARNAEVAPGDYVMLAVTDTGTGISADVMDRVFEPFFTTKGVGEGSGLGLSMVYGFAKQSGGHLKIYSEVGHGTTVRLYLPRAKAVEAADPTPTGQSDDLRGAEAILVVEDDEAVRQLAVAQLQSFGYRVVEASNAERALTLLRSPEPIDLLFTDVVMPGGMTGRQLAEEGRRLRPSLQVLFTSGYTPNSIVHQGKLDPGVHLLSKPYRRAELARKVREVLDSES
jgi:PAS domain S-box-containing protein